MRRAVALLGLAVVLAGCGSHHAQPRPEPRLPRVLAQPWSREASAIAAALAAEKTCLAQRRAEQLLGDVVAAINAGRVPPALLERLTSSVNALPAQIACPGNARPAAEANAHKLAAWLLAHSR